MSEGAQGCLQVSTTNNERFLATANVSETSSLEPSVPQVSCLSSSVPQVSWLSLNVHKDPHKLDTVLLPIPLHGQSPLTSQTQNTNVGRQASGRSDLSGAEGWSGPHTDTA